MYQPRTYRHWIRDSDLVSFNVVVKETDLCISARTNLRRKALRLVSKYRSTLERYITQHPSFLTSMEALPIDDDTPQIIKMMLEAAYKARVGPMASVAGAIAECVGTELLAFSPEVIVENGGDIYLRISKKRVIGVYAGNSPLSGKIGLEINGRDTPLGVCTSSGTVGHSLSYGKADAVIALSRSATLADAAATAIGNLIKEPTDISSGIEVAQSIAGLKGVIIIIGSDMGLWGEVKICQTAL
jgi:ApbE superfamily uncharacterized protein (UPF0280 family)